MIGLFILLHQATGKVAATADVVVATTVDAEVKGVDIAATGVVTAADVVADAVVEVAAVATRTAKVAATAADTAVVAAIAVVDIVGAIAVGGETTTTIAIKADIKAEISTAPPPRRNNLLDHLSRFARSSSSPSSSLKTETNSRTNPVPSPTNPWDDFTLLEE